MTSEVITTKRDTEIGRLLERVIRDHRKDIADFSKGSDQEPTGPGSTDYWSLSGW